jgi:hypothetical protein
MSIPDDQPLMECVHCGSWFPESGKDHHRKVCTQWGSYSRRAELIPPNRGPKRNRYCRNGQRARTA